MFKIYYIDGCPYCIKALQIFNELNLKINKVLVHPTEKEQINKQNKMNTYPQIFYKNKNIGGCDDLIELKNASNTICKYMKNENLNILSDVCKILCKNK